MTLWLRSLGLAVVALSALAPSAEWTFTIVHTNDVHARMEPARIRGKEYGGRARLSTLIRQAMKSEKNPILLDAGDVFQGTLYFNVYEGLSDLAAMNAVGYQAMAVGNHEFDRGPKPLATFARLATFPLLAANIDVSQDPDLKDLIKPSTVLTVDGQRIGIVGLLTSDTPAISSPGPTVRFLDTVSSVQKAIDSLSQQGINKIVVLSHQGYRDDLAVIRKLKSVDIVVGGHSHTSLGRYQIEGFPNPAGEYPTVTKNADGETALVVQAWEWGKVLGVLQVTFDDRGIPVKWSTDSPRVVDESVAPDLVVASLVEGFKRPIAELQTKEIGSTTTGLSRDGSRETETAMGNVIADAMLEATKKAGSVAAFTNSGGIRASIEPGTITYGSAITVTPFSNTLVLLDLSGSELRAAVEYGVGAGGMLHPSKGFAYEYDPRKPEGQRIVSITLNGAPIDPAKTYRVTMNSFIANGGDGHEGLKNAKGYRLDTGLVDIDALVSFIQANSPVNAKLEGRIKRL
jgi:5'-nucleotidase